MEASRKTTTFNNKTYKQRRQILRQNTTEPEKRLWQILRKRQLGYKFRRQHGIGYYIVDFYCPELKLVIEVDGDSHFSEAAQYYDAKRDNFLCSQGILTIRVNNNDVMNNIESIYQFLRDEIDFRAKKKFTY